MFGCRLLLGLIGSSAIANPTVKMEIASELATKQYFEKRFEFMASLKILKIQAPRI